MASAWLRTVCFVAVTPLFGCSGNPKSERAVKTDELPESGPTQDGVGWQSAPFPNADDCADPKARWLRLGGNTESEGLVIEHALGRAPELILPYIAFGSDGCGSTLGSGDTVVIDYADDKVVRVHNNTGEYFYIRLVLQ